MIIALICSPSVGRHEEQEPTGVQRLGLHYDQFAVIEGACQRRRADRIEAQLDALEASAAA